MIFLKSNILPIIIAGLMNGSFVIPTKYIKNTANEKIWFYHSIIGLMIIPWIILALTAPNEMHKYFLLQPSILEFLIFGGVIFGLGQVCFASAIERIGIALGFAINLGIGVTIGSMYVVLDKNAFFTIQGCLVTLAVILIISSLIIYYFSGKNPKDHADFATKQNAHYHAGWLFASLAGLASGFQNIVFVIVAFHSKTQFQTDNSFWVWPPFLFAAAIPMLFGFFYRMQTNQKIQIGNKFLNFKSTSLVGLMGLLFTGSLALYSGGMSRLTSQQQIVGWPTLMVSIILVSQLWGLVYRESNIPGMRNKLFKFCSLVLLVAAIIILAGEV